jgi:hypothetical protein
VDAFGRPTNGEVQVALTSIAHHGIGHTRKLVSQGYSLLRLLFPNILLAPVPTLFRHSHQNYGESSSRSQSDHASTYPRRSMHRIQVVLLTHSHSLSLPPARLYCAPKCPYSSYANIGTEQPGTSSTSMSYSILTKPSRVVWWP